MQVSAGVGVVDKPAHEGGQLGWFLLCLAHRKELLAERYQAKFLHEKKAVNTDEDAAVGTALLARCIDAIKRRKNLDWVLRGLHIFLFDDSNTLANDKCESISPYSFSTLQRIQLIKFHRFAFDFNCA